MEFFQGSCLLHPHMGLGEFGLCLVFLGTIMVQGGVIDFYHANRFGGGVWVNFSSMLEPAGFGRSVIYILTPHIL